MNRESRPLAALLGAAGPYMPAVLIGAGALAVLARLLSEEKPKPPDGPTVPPVPETPRVPTPPEAPETSAADAHYPRHASGRFAPRITLADLRAVFAGAPLAKADAVARLCHRTGCSRSAGYYTLARRFGALLAAGDDGRWSLADQRGAAHGQDGPLQINVLDPQVERLGQTQPAAVKQPGDEVGGVSCHVPNGLQEGAGFGYGRRMTQKGRPLGAERVDVLQRGAQHVFAEAGEGVESCVLGAGGGVAPQPVDVAGLGGQGLEMSANDFLQAADRFRRVHIRTSLYSIHEPAVV